MNRPIKYRGKSVSNGKWVYGERLNSRYLVGYSDSKDYTDTIFYEVKEDTVDQYTGMKDIRNQDGWKYKTPSAKNEQTYRAAKRKPTYKDGDYQIVSLDRVKVINMILADMTIPQIHDAMPEYSYDQIYDTILCDAEFNSLYRQHGQLKIKKR